MRPRTALRGRSDAGHHDSVSKRRRQGQPSGDSGVPVELDEMVGSEVEWPSPIRDGVWVDAAGTRWQLRGERSQQTPAKRVEHLLRSADVKVLLFYGPEPPREIAPGDRDALWQRMSPYLRSAEAGTSDSTDFLAGEFRDGERRSLLIIEEFC